MSFKGLITFFFFLAIFGYISYFIYHKFFVPPQKKLYKTEYPKKRNIYQIIHATGTLEIKDHIKIGSLVGGTIKDIYVEENEYVKKGQLLTEIDNGKSDTDVKEKEGEVEYIQMDHFASVMGGIIHVDCGHNNRLTRLDARLEGIVIGDSQEKKQDTVGDLRKIRLTVEEGYQHLASQIDDFDHRETPLIEVQGHLDKIPKHCRVITETTIRNRDLTSRALDILKSKRPNPEIIGAMLDEHHTLLRDGFERSTPKIEKIIRAATKAGALGCKINGSGGGGTILAFAPGNEKKVAEAIKKAGGVPYLTRIGQGSSLTILRE